MRTAYILGSANCVFADLRAAPKMEADDGIIAVNEIGVDCKEELAAWCSLHGEFFPSWTKRREAAEYSACKELYTAPSAAQQRAVAKIAKGVPSRFPDQTHPGSSAIFATKVALMDLGYDRVILCGCPLVVEGNHYNNKDKWGPATSYWQGWKDALPHLTGKVFSMSGWTRKFLGAPEGCDPDYVAKFEQPVPEARPIKPEPVTEQEAPAVEEAETVVAADQPQKQTTTAQRRKPKGATGTDVPER